MEAAERGERAGSVIDILVVQTLARHAAGDTRAALNSLARAVSLAEPEGYVRIFVDEGVPMAHLLYAAAAQGMMTDYTGKLLAAFEDATNDQRPMTNVRPSSLVEPLSARELEVLHLIAQGLSNGEISARLFLALSTIKGHNRNIFGKLQVERRTEAVARARELGLL